MAKTRPPYPPEFRRQMVELVRAGRTPEELAREFEPTAQSIRNWVAADVDEEPPRRRPDDGGARGTEPAAAREPPARVEREILSKAAAWFARETNTIPAKGLRFVSENQASYPIATMCRCWVSPPAATMHGSAAAIARVRDGCRS